MTQEHAFAVLLLAACVGTAWDFTFGRQMRRRGVFQAGVALLYILVFLTFPSCSLGPPDTGLELPYTF